MSEPIQLNGLGIASKIRAYRRQLAAHEKSCDAETVARRLREESWNALEAIRLELGAQAALLGREIVFVDHDGLAFIIPVPPTGYKQPPFTIKVVPATTVNS